MNMYKLINIQIYKFSPEKNIQSFENSSQPEPDQQVKP